MESLVLMGVGRIGEDGDERRNEKLTLTVHHHTTISRTDAGYVQQKIANEKC